MLIFFLKSRTISNEVCITDCLLISNRQVFRSPDLNLESLRRIANGFRPPSCGNNRTFLIISEKLHDQFVPNLGGKNKHKVLM